MAVIRVFRSVCVNGWIGTHVHGNRELFHGFRASAAVAGARGVESRPINRRGWWEGVSYFLLEFANCCAFLFVAKDFELDSCVASEGSCALCPLVLLKVALLALGLRGFWFLVLARV